MRDGCCDGLNEDPTRLIDWFDDFRDNDAYQNRFSFLSNFAIEFQPAWLDQTFANLMAPQVLAGMMGDMRPDQTGAYGITVDDEGGTYPHWTGEHLFQAAKARDYADWQDIMLADTPAIAKSMGRNVDLRPDWEQVKFEVMRAVVRVKFRPGTYRADQLMELTGDAYLMEGTYWNDEIWGVNLTKPYQPGQNWLGLILMEQRAWLRLTIL